MLSKFKELLNNKEWLNKLIDFEALDRFIIAKDYETIYGDHEPGVDTLYSLVYKGFKMVIDNGNDELIIQNKDIICFYNLIIKDYENAMQDKSRYEFFLAVGIQEEIEKMITILLEAEGIDCD